MSEKELFPLKSEKPEAKDVQEILSRYLRYWYLFAIGAALGIGGAYVYLRYYTVPLYSISSTVLIKSDKSETSSSALSEIGMLKSSNSLENEIEVLLSHSLMQRVVSELGLFTSYYVEGQVRDIEIYGKALPIKVVISSFDSTVYGKTIAIHIRSSSSFDLEENTGTLTTYKFGEKIQKRYGSFTVLGASGTSLSNVPIGQKVIVRFDDMRQVAAHYNNALMIYPSSEEASVLKISLIDPIPEKGKRIINKLIEIYNREAIEDKNLIAASTIEFLDERLKYITSEITDVEKDVEQYKRQNELTDVSAQATNYLAQASDYNKKLAEWAIQIDVLESIENYISQSQNQYKIVPSTLNIQDPTLLSLISKFNELQLERERLLRTAYSNNPLVQNINEQLEILRGNIQENLRNIKKGLIITSNNLRASSGQFQSKISKVPSMERELMDINRQQAIKQNLYSYLLQKREETAISLAANVSNSRIIDPARATDYPISPNRQTIYLISLLIGLAVPFAGLFLKDTLNNTVQVQQDVSLLTGTPILGDLMHSDFKETLVVERGSRAPIVEMFRLIRAKLYFAAVDRENKTILVTSSMSGEGKTFFSINMGASLVLTGKKVVLVELDLRNPSLSEELGIRGQLGISDYLVSNNIIIDKIINPYEDEPGLYVVSAGPIPLDPSELMMSPKLAHLISELKDRFDHVIIDTAPVGQVADAFSLSELVDSTIYLVRYNYTLKKQIAIIESIYRNKELKHPMIVLNDAKKINGANYGYGYGYGYGKGTLKRGEYTVS